MRERGREEKKGGRRSGEGRIRGREGEGRKVQRPRPTEGVSQESESWERLSATAEETARRREEEEGEEEEEEGD